MDFAVIVGIDDYLPIKEGGLRQLHGAKRDAGNIYKWLTEQCSEKVSLSNCKRILSTSDPLHPIKDDIDDAIIKIHSFISENKIDARRFYFYFSGHGLGHEDDATDIALCPARWTQLKRHTAISIESYRKKLLTTGYFK